MIIYFDIETLPTDDDEVIAELAANIKPPANYSKPETIAKWEQENKLQAVADAVSKTALDALYGRIACIAWAFEDGAIESTLAADTEEQAITRFYESVRNTPGAVSLVACGHNVHGFDLPFLRQRSIIKGINVPSELYIPMMASPYASSIADTMLLWSREKRVGMDKLCRMLGIEGKGDMDGSKVAETWEHDKQKVIDYCCGDVERTRKLYKRMTFK